jgi:endonuclease III
VGEAEAALIDSILSAGARYRDDGTEVRAAIVRWRVFRGDARLDDLSQLADMDASQLSAVLQNSQRVPGRNPKRLSKAAAIVATARNLVGDLQALDADTILEVHSEEGARLEKVVTSVSGVGHVTYIYFLMLLGVDAVKVDAHLIRLVSWALGRPVSERDVEHVLGAAARELRLEQRQLDYALWAAMRRGGTVPSTPR